MVDSPDRMADLLETVEIETAPAPSDSILWLHGLGADGKPGQCAESYGILQNRYPYEQSAWPGIGPSNSESLSCCSTR